MLRILGFRQCMMTYEVMISNDTQKFTDIKIARTLTFDAAFKGVSERSGCQCQL